MNKYAISRPMGTGSGLILACAVTIAAGACEDAPGVTDPDFGAARPATSLEVSPAYALTGDQVRVGFRVPQTPSGDAIAYASVTWDPTVFEFVGAEPADLEQYLFGNPDQGRMLLLPSDAAGAWVTLVFVALQDGETQGFAVTSRPD